LDFYICLYFFNISASYSCAFLSSASPAPSASVLHFAAFGGTIGFEIGS